MLITAERDGYISVTAATICKSVRVVSASTYDQSCCSQLKVRPVHQSNASPGPEERTPETRTELVRGLGLPQSIALNISNMVGIGPFITIPGFIAAMHGPQALIAWVVAAVLVICDGLV